MLKRLLFLSLLPLCSYAEDLPPPVKAIEKQGITIIKPFEAPRRRQRLARKVSGYGRCYLSHPRR